MHNLPTRDGDRQVDWSETSEDYARHRAGYPESFFERLGRHVDLRGRKVADLGTGTGALALALAERGAQVCGVDIAPGQISMAQREAGRRSLTAEFTVAHAEDTRLPSASFDLVSASQCWPYFDRDRAIAEVRRLLGPGGLLITCHLSWLPHEDAIAGASEALLLEHNPDWGGANWNGEVPKIPRWVGPDFEVAEHFVYDEPLPYTHESWRGRFRACRGVGATLSPEAVRAFDEAHAALLERIAPQAFGVLHRIDAHFLRPVG